MPSAAFLPPSLKAIRVDPQSPMEIDFIIDSADQSNVDQKQVNKLVQYFLASMTTPEKDMWVNLSPYESQRIIAPQFGETSAGRELLAQDQLLKQLAASLTYPESVTGKAFWSRVYQKAIAMYGTTAIPIDTFQRVWIMPEKAVVYEYNGTAFITESRLKVLMEDDYKALKNAQSAEGSKRISEREAQKVNNFSATITREIIVPEIEKEINEGKNFAPLRQVFNAIILATWFKKKLKQHILAKVYVDQQKVKGIEDDTQRTAERIYQQYVEVLKEGVYNYVRGDYDAPSQSVISRQYFSGGFSIGNPSEWLDIRPISNILISSRDFLAKLGRKLLFAKIRLRPLGVGGVLQLPVFSPPVAGPMAATIPAQSRASANVNAVLTASFRVVEGTELVNFFIEKFQKAMGQVNSSLLVFIRGPASVINNAEILKKAVGIKNAVVYIIDNGKINSIGPEGEIGPEVSSSVALAGGLVLVVSPDEKVRYLEATAVEKKTGLSRTAQLDKYLTEQAAVFAGGPEKKDVAGVRNTGGIDMQVEKSLEIKGQDLARWGAALTPDILLQDMKGVDFEILELTPIINSPVFLPNFTSFQSSR